MHAKITKVLSRLIDETIDSLLNNSPIVKDVEINAGKDFVSKYLSDLKRQLLKEVVIDNKPGDSRYTPLSQIYNNKKLQKAKINNISVNIYKDVKKRNNSNEYLINIVFPSRNSSKIIHGAIELLVSEISKAHNIDFNVIFQVNNTSDNTIQKIQESLEQYKHLQHPVNFYILETEPELQFSLPGSLNLGYSFILKLVSKVNKKYKEVFFSFWDDELLNLIPTPDSLFNSNLNELLSSSHNKAVSGYMIDNRVNVSRWHELCKGFSSDIRFIYSKPYLHGGSGTVMKLKDYPVNGIKLGGIADTDLSEHLLNQFDYEDLKKLSHQQWPVRSNRHAPVFHPIETDILKWTIKYLMYQIAWENTYNSLNSSDNSKIGTLWKKRISENRIDFHKTIDKYIINLSVEKVLDREFMHFYYLTIQSIKNKKALYEDLKKYRSRSLNIR